MSLPYESATAVSDALNDMRKILSRFGCAKICIMTDNEVGELILQFTWQQRAVTVRATYCRYAAAWLREHPYNRRSKKTPQAHESEAIAQGEINVCSALRDWVKGQVTAIETGILTFEGAFLGQIMLPNGKTVLEAAETTRLLR